MRRFSLDDFLDRFNIDRYAGGYGGGPFGNPRRPSSGQSDVEIPDVARPVFWGLIGLSALIALGLGGLLAGSWTTVQLFAHRVPFAQTDPTFGLNIGFYVFELPFYRLLQSFANTLLLLSVVLAGARYLVAVDLRRLDADRGPRPCRRARDAVPAVDRRRVPARPIFACLQRPERHLPGSQLHRRQRQSPGHQRHDRPGRLCRDPVPALLLHPLVGAADPDRRSVARRVRRTGFRLPAHHPAVRRGPQPADAGNALHPEQHRHDPARVQPEWLDQRPVSTRRAERPDDPHTGVAHKRAIHDPEPAPVGLPAARPDARQHAAAPELLQLRRCRHGQVHLHGPRRPAPPTRPRACAR